MLFSSNFDEFDHGAHLRRAFELANEAAERGDHPFGSVLVLDDEIVLTDSNRVVTENDIRRHPELHLAHLACQKFSAEERARMVMYTSTEPCPMCAGGIRAAGLARVYYSVASHDLTELNGYHTPVRSAAILEGVTQVVGPLLHSEGMRIHKDYGW